MNNQDQIDLSDDSQNDAAVLEQILHSVRGASPISNPESVDSETELEDINFYFSADDSSDQQS